MGSFFNNNYPHILYRTPEQQLILAMEFAQKHAMLQNQASWKDTRALQQLIDIINLKK